jgi:hypothetical protein
MALSISRPLPVWFVPMVKDSVGSCFLVVVVGDHCRGWPPWHCPYLVLFLCGSDGYNSTSTPVVRSVAADQHPDLLARCLYRSDGHHGAVGNGCRCCHGSVP